MHIVNISCITNIPCFSFQTVICFPIYFLRLGIDFAFNFKFNIQLSFPQDGNSLDCPVKLSVQVSKNKDLE